MTHDTALAGTKPAAFYVVSIKKFLFMCVITMGWYLVAWSYLQWTHYKRSTGANIWPAFRSIVGLLYVFHSSATFNAHSLSPVAIMSGIR